MTATVGPIADDLCPESPETSYDAHGGLVNGNDLADVEVAVAEHRPVPADPLRHRPLPGMAHCPYDPRNRSLMSRLSRDRICPSLLTVGGGPAVSNVHRNWHPWPPGWMSNLVRSYGRSGHSVDQTTRAGSTLSKIWGST